MGISLDDPMFFQKVNAIAGDKLNQESMAKHIEEEKARDTKSETLTLEKLLRFLNGEAPISGRWFGEKYEGEPAFWWRPELKRLIETEIQERVNEARLDELKALFNSEIANISLKKMQIRINGRIAELTKEEGKV